MAGGVPLVTRIPCQVPASPPGSLASLKVGRSGAEGTRLLAGHRKTDQLLVGHERKRRRRAVDEGTALAGDHGAGGRRTALVGHVLELDAEFLLHHARR